MDGRSLAEIAKLLGVHESTISRRVKRLGETLRQRLLKKLQAYGLSRRAAEEALSCDVRDIDVNLRQLLQVAGAGPFQNRGANALTTVAGEEN
jgi:RNA polymerase sigma-70 factor (ECF subfamily)